MEEKENLGQYIAKRRKYMGLTQEELAEKVGVSKSAIAKWETNRGLPDRDNLKILSVAINIPVEEMHRIIDRAVDKTTDVNVNITSDVVAVLESYGYKVIRPDAQAKS